MWILQSSFLSSFLDLVDIAPKLSLVKSVLVAGGQDVCERGREGTYENVWVRGLLINITKGLKQKLNLNFNFFWSLTIDIDLF